MKLAIIAVALLAVAVAGQNQVCEPGSVFQVSCNTCRCSMDGTNMACTRKQCAPEPEREMFCVPGSVFRIDCNTCMCNDDGMNAACTMKACF